MPTPTSPGSLLPYHSNDHEAYPSRLFVSLFAWFGLFIGTLHVVSGRALGLVEITISSFGVYATWSDVYSRTWYVAAFAFGWCVQAVFETFFLVLLLAATSSYTSQYLGNLISSATFQNLMAPLSSLFATLKEDVGGFAIFSSLTSVVFAWMAHSYGIALWKEVTASDEPLAQPNARTPLVRREPPQRTNIGGFGSLGQSPRQQPPQRQAFQGKGQRLGFE